MNLKWLTDLRGVNYWLLASAIGMNLIWTYLTLFFGAALFIGNIDESMASDARSLEGIISTVQVGLMVSIFVGSFITGWMTGKMGMDNRGPTYGVIGSVGSVGLIVFSLLQTGAGIFSLLLAAVAVAGGLNGGITSLDKVKRVEE